MIGVNLNLLTYFHIHKDLISPISWWDVYQGTQRRFTLIDPDRNELEYKGYFHSVGGARARAVERLRSALVRHAGLQRLRTDFSFIDVMSTRGIVVGCLEELLAGRSAYGPVQLAADELDQVQIALGLFLE